MPESLDDIIQFLLENVTWVIFAIFMLSGLFGRSGGKKTSSTDPVEPAPREWNTDNRPLAERMAEHFGVPLEEIQGRPPAETRPQPPARQREQRYASEGRRSPSTGSSQDDYPDLFSGQTVWDEEPADDGYSHKNTAWGFDESEWGSTFEKNDSQWGGTFPEKKSSEPRIEVT